MGGIDAPAIGERPRCPRCPRRAAHASSITPAPAGAHASSSSSSAAAPGAAAGGGGAGICAPGSRRLLPRLPARRPAGGARALALARMQRLRRLNKRLQREQLQRRSASPGGGGGLCQHLLAGQQLSGDTASSGSSPEGPPDAGSNAFSEHSDGGGYYQQGWGPSRTA
jgi:hypothetical protein